MAIKRKLESTNEYGDGVAWIRGPILGKGSFGSVYKANLKNPKSQFSFLPAEMAVKSAEASVSSTLRDEKEIMSRLKGCTFIIRCYGEETTIGDNGVMAYNLLLEYGSGGTLADRIKKQWRLSEVEVRAHTRSLLRGLSHIHGLGYVHCDLKPENTLLVPSCGEGLSKKSSNKRRKLTEACHWRGTPMYLSPESVTGFAQEAPSDIWALGCVVLEMLTGKRPWEGEKEEILTRIGAEKELPKIPDWISEDAWDFLMCCFEREPGQRLTAELLLDHPFVDASCNYDGDVEELDEFSCDRSIPDDWLLSSCKNAKNASFTRHYPLIEGPVAFPIAAGV
ncbi:mitogen-activated protein kinase kinase kinase anp1 [Phtheirospermum japonicum]|uniref:Mitogen-activated protein kinase kinase kinase anp1 n=1 Tax=Phtheirospermum japonicum TaxID=374723 RepID=A0A830BQ64_9LAMI|nr:mitogen-activated protein kinase kinase kinase anp1 [Phtheirospermum japonicum]